MASLISPIIGLINRISFINRVSSPVGKPFLNFFPKINEDRKKLFEEEGHYIETPMYLPEGYHITEYRKEATPILELSDGKGKVSISFMFYESDEEVRDFSILEEKSTETEITVNGHTGYYISTENGDFLTYRFENTIALYAFSDIDQNEISKIINSIK